jgi:hypothetical protein
MLVRQLTNEQLLDEGLASAIDGLRKLRNAAAHDDGSGLSVSVQRAKEYVALGEAVAEELERARAARTAT